VYKSSWTQYWFRPAQAAPHQHPWFWITLRKWTDHMLLLPPMKKLHTWNCVAPIWFLYIPSVSDQQSFLFRVSSFSFTIFDWFSSFFGMGTSRLLYVRVDKRFILVSNVQPCPSRNSWRWGILSAVSIPESQLQADQQYIGHIHVGQLLMIISSSPVLK